MFRLRSVFAALAVVLVSVAPAWAARPIVDLHKLDAYFALFASDSNVPWHATKVRLDTYSGAPVQFAVYQVHPGDVLTAGTNARPRAIDTRGRKPIARFTYTPPGGYRFQSNQVALPLGSREGFFVVEARRGPVGEQVWVNRTRVGLVAKETPGELLVYGTDLGTGRALSHMRVQFVVNGRFVDRFTDAHGVTRWNTTPRPVFALAQWGDSYAFTSLLPQPPLPNAIVGVRTDSAVVHAGGMVRVVGFARRREGAVLKAGSGTATVSMRLGGMLVAQRRVALDPAGAFATTLAVPPAARAGDYAVLAQADGGVGGATVHVDADANGLSLTVASGCENRCNPARDVPVEIRSSRGDVPVRVTVVRSPHVYVGYTPQTTPWATTRWLHVVTRTDGSGRATVMIPHPTDTLASTYGIRVESGGATAVTRIVVPTARVAVRLHVDRKRQTLGTPVGFDVYVNDVATGKPLANATVTVRMSHGPSVQQQFVRLDEDGHARGSFSTPSLGTNMIMASVTVAQRTAVDAGQVNVVPQATGKAASAGSSDARVTLDRAVYRAGEMVHVEASLPGSVGDALITLESAMGSQTDTAPVAYGRARASLRVNDAPGDLRVGAAFVRDGKIEWTSTPLDLDAAGRPQLVRLRIAAASFVPGALATLTLPDTRAGAGTVVVRISRGAPSGSALFDSAPALMAVGLAATDVSAPAGRTWHPWVNSTGQHAQVLGFVRRTLPPQNLTISQADTQVVSWTIVRDDGAPLVVHLPNKRGRYVISLLKIADDGRVIAASRSVFVR